MCQYANGGTYFCNGSCQNAMNAQANSSLMHQALAGNMIYSQNNQQALLGQNIYGTSWVTSTSYPNPKFLAMDEATIKQRIYDFKKGTKTKEQVVTYIKLVMYEGEIDTLKYLEFMNDIESIEMKVEENEQKNNPRIGGVSLD